MWIPRLADFISISGGGSPSLDVSALKTLSERAEGIEKGLGDTADAMRRQIYDLEWSGAASRAATDRADREYQDVRKVADAYGRLGELSSNAYNDMSYPAAYLTSTTLQLMADGFTVDQDWTVHAPEGGDTERATNDTASLQAQAKEIGSAMEKWAPQISGVVQDLRLFAPAASASRFTIDPAEVTEIKGRPAGSGPASLHEQLLAKYNVTPDPDGTIMYPADPDSALGKALASLGIESKRVTVGEAVMLDQLDTHGVIAAAMIEYGASEEAKTIFEDQPRAGGVGDGHADAFRHAYWNALLSKEFGQDWAEDFTTAHERIDGETSHASAEAMDLHNNEVGRRIQAEHPNASPAELKDLVKQAVLDGKMVVVGPDGQLMYSNQVEMGKTGVTDNEPAAKGGHDPAVRGGEPKNGTY
ncbi:hypothetical protein AB0E01_29705 [Nocardia vinacea]|uniref:DUF6973 domain-containing protein n=1 Tax=Nocardia vinacea TaxID=96468 RepID=UPI003401D490